MSTARRNCPKRPTGPIHPMPLLLAAAGLAACMLLAPAPARAELLESGPAVQFGYSPDEDASGRSQNLGLVALGWRWRWNGAEGIDELFAKARLDVSWAVEGLAGVEFGDAEAFEASVVPLMHLRLLGSEGLVPWFEVGIGLAYTGLRNYGLGSSVTLSDNVGAGIAFEAGGRTWSVGYRFRHLSHAGILSEHNDGLNAHFLTVSVPLD